MKKIVYYTDGSSRGNPGIGGASCIKVSEDEIVDIKSKHFKSVTNNQAELTGIKMALEDALENNLVNFVINSDSAYCINMLNDWIYTWAANGWINSKKKTIENLELVQSLFKLINSFDYARFEFKKVPGHSGLFFNELADAVAADNQKKYDELMNKYISERKNNNG